MDENDINFRLLAELTGDQAVVISSKFFPSLMHRFKLVNLY